MTNFKDIERALSRLESEGSGVDRTHIPLAQALRLRAAFAAVEEPIDPERVAELFVYGPDGPEFTDAEAEAVRTIAWREKFGEEPPWNGNGP